MIIEKMLELLLLETYKTNAVLHLSKSDLDKYLQRLKKLKIEFLEQYVTNSDSKE